MMMLRYLLLFVALLSLVLAKSNTTNNKPTFTTASTSFSTSFSTSSSTSTSTAHSSSYAEEKERERYASLPHTIFAPNGRLYNVEKAALSSSSSTTGKKQDSSNLVLALKFGDSILIASANSIQAPFLQHDDDDLDRGQTAVHHQHQQQKEEKEEEPLQPLWTTTISQPPLPTTTPRHPISILSSNLIMCTGSGGGDSSRSNLIDSIVLHIKIQEIYISLSKAMNQMTSTHGIKGIIPSCLLARKVSDSLQITTQDMSNGKILASAALVIGINEAMIQNQIKSKNKIWRIDPTGQFWDCEVAAVGAGAGLVEGEMMRLVKRSKDDKHGSDDDDNDDDDDDCHKRKRENDSNDNHEENDHDDDDNNYLESLIASISNDDVHKFLQRMTFDDAIQFACQCICKVYKISNRNDLQSISIQGILMPNRTSRPEMIHSAIISECFNTILIGSK